MEKKKSIWEVLKSSVAQWLEDQPFQMASSLAYYTIFSLAPLLIIVIAIAGFAFGERAAEQQIVEKIQGTIGQQGAEAVQGMIQNASSQPKTGVISGLLGFVALLFGAGGVVGQLQGSLNTIWGVAPKPGQGAWGFIRQRFISFAMILGIGFLLLVLLVVSAAVSGLAQLIGNFLMLAYALDLIISFLFTTALFAMIYKFLPDVQIRWGDVWIGAALTSLLFTIGKFLIGLYLGHSGVTSTYGAAGSLITILLWVYYSSLIFFLGAEFTQVYATEYGSGVAPAEHALPISLLPRKTPPPERRSSDRAAGRRTQAGERISRSQP
ncbi:MAG TPA: YihY/virulence factor BrkB family protein [Candidatus Binatia bacterium]